jgi:hypothetical protein
MMRIFSVAALLLAVAVIVVVAAWPASARPPAAHDAVPAGPGITIIETNTQATLDDVRIGVGNIRESEWTDAGGTTRRGLTAALFISVRDDASKDTKLRVHPGQTFTASKQRFEVLAVDATRVQLRSSKL